MDMRMLPKLLLVIVLATSAAAWPQPAETPVVLTPAQKKILSDTRVAAQTASAHAEKELLDMFSSPLFRFALKLAGSGDLAQMESQELLDILKDNLASLEYTDNFGLDAESRKLHPGREAMDLPIIEKYGHIPNDWEMKMTKCNLTANVSKKQWAIYDAAETGIYGLPEFANPEHPTTSETLERPKYLGGNLRRQALGLQRYGAISVVMRNDVVRDRAVISGSDSGGWEGVCNKSVTPIKNGDNSWWHKMMVDCDSIYAGGWRHPILGVVDHQLHTIVANTRMFLKVGGSLPQVLHQLLTPGAKVRPIEVNMYTEAVLFGASRPADWKMVVGSFPGLFGTTEGSALRAFCNRYRIPLAWGLGSGRMWPDEASQKYLLIPYEPFYFWEAGQARLLDSDAGWHNTNVTGPPGHHGLWDRVWAEVVVSRQLHPTIAGPGKDAFEAWWAKLSSASWSVPPLRARDCASADLCFGTYQPSGKAPDCVCRKPSRNIVVV